MGRDRASVEHQYDLAEHRHRFAAWAASSAARQSPKCRFSVKEGFALLEESGLRMVGSSPDRLPEPGDFDLAHGEWRGTLCSVARRLLGNPNSVFTHGVAAKLINCYFKALFTCGGHESHRRARGIHPPIDRLLLMELAAKDVGGLRPFWREYAHKGWSNFESGDYENVIKKLRLVGGDDLWRVEEFWGGHRTPT